MLQAIAHPTDFSPESSAAFEHALAWAVREKCRLDLLHVRDPAARDDFAHFPHVREVLQRWGMLDADARIEDIVSVTGVVVRKAEIGDVDPVDGVARYLATHKPDLVVMATHGRKGLNRWLKGSVSVQIAQETLVPTLLLGPRARSLVDGKTGSLELRRVLVPVDDHPPAGPGLARLRNLLSDMTIELDLVHVGDTRLELAGEDAVRRLEGPVAGTILAEAENADLVAMPTAGPHGILEALRGSTTEQVVRSSPQPVLALPTRTD